MASVAATQIEHALHFAFDFNLVVRESLLNQPSTKANDVLIRIPVSHEISAVNGIPVFVGCGHSVIQVLVQQFRIDRRLREQVCDTLARMSITERIRRPARDRKSTRLNSSHVSES